MEWIIYTQTECVNVWRNQQTGELRPRRRGDGPPRDRHVWHFVEGLITWDVNGEFWVCGRP